MYQHLCGVWFGMGRNSCFLLIFFLLYLRRNWNFKIKFEIIRKKIFLIKRISRYEKENFIFRLRSTWNNRHNIFCHFWQDEIDTKLVFFKVKQLWFLSVSLGFPREWHHKKNVFMVHYPLKKYFYWTTTWKLTTDNCQFSEGAVRRENEMIPPWGFQTK